MNEPLATHDFADGGLEAALAFFHRTRDELRTLRRVRVSTESVRLFDVNGDFFELRGLGYPDPNIIPVLKSFDTPLQTGSDPRSRRRPLQRVQDRPPLSLVRRPRHVRRTRVR